MNLSERISKLRKEKGLTQIELAYLIGVTDKAVSKWECGDGNPDIMTLPILANILGSTVDFLLTGKDGFLTDKLSPIELCAKDDGVERYEELKRKLGIRGVWTEKDENDKTFFDSYII